MSWKIGVLALLIGCGAETVTPGTQDFGDFDQWGSGIEGFSIAPTTDTNTSGGTADSSYDGPYIGSYTLTLSHNGYVCTFSSVPIQVLVTNGTLSTPFPTPTSNSCDLSYGTATYSPNVSFDGTIASGGTLSGLIIEDSSFVFEATWTGSIMDLGNGTFQAYADFEEEVTTDFPPGLTTVSGSFILETP